MPQYVVLAVYGASAVLSLGLLFLFGAKAWYWHALSVGLALAIGLVPPPMEIAGKSYDLTVGFLFTFLFLWGAAAPVMRLPLFQQGKVH